MAEWERSVFGIDWGGHSLERSSERWAGRPWVWVDRAEQDAEILTELERKRFPHK